MKNKTYVCRRLRLLTHLLQNGFEPFRTQPDVKNPRMCVWLFVDCPELRDCIEDYYSQPFFTSGK